MQIREVTTQQELRRLSPWWDELLGQSTGASPFLSFDWIDCWWQHFGAERELLVLIAEDEHGPAGIAPLIISRYRYHRLPVRVLEFIGAPFRGACLASRLEVIAARQPEQCLTAFAETMLAHSDRWDLCSLRGVPTESCSIERLAHAVPHQFRLIKNTVYQVPLVCTGGADWETHLASLPLPSRFRNWLRRVEKRAQKAGLGAVTTITGQELEATFPELTQVCDASWKAAQGSGLFHTNGESREFLCDFIRRISEQGQLLLATISAQGETIAYQLSFHHSRALWFYDTSYDERFGAAFPGANLLAALLREAFDSGVERIDLGPGLQPYKLQWSNAQEERVNWLGFHRGWRSRLLEVAARSAMKVRKLRERHAAQQETASSDEVQ